VTDIFAKVVLDSVSPDGVRLPTVQMRYPRFIHAELMTHRVFSRNARSSRAVPVERMLREVEANPVVPLHWGANQKGMQADRECDESVELALANVMGRLDPVKLSNHDAWLWARDNAVRAAHAFTKAGYHKQVVNRLLEPFLHIDVLVTSTQWSNFLALRLHSAAEPHIRLLAYQVQAALERSTPKLLQPGEWHLPYVDQDPFGLDYEAAHRYLTDEVGREATNLNVLHVLRKVSVARCARISYAPFDGDGLVSSEVRRHDDLVSAVPMHASPAEHQATPDTPKSIGISDWTHRWWHPEEHGNFTGWRQYRKTLQGECL
jgi:hypothetical protein